ncbi:MAG: hypothetical protein K2X09_06675, partial [Rickettsiales bacterium]|nr:hypothetical protein [Rickettsiales bacterium]
KFALLMGSKRLIHQAIVTKASHWLSPNFAILAVWTKVLNRKDLPRMTLSRLGVTLLRACQLASKA